MFEFHGWATLRFTAENRDRDDEDALQDAAVEQVRSYVQRLGYDTAGKMPDPPLMDKPRSRFSGNLISAVKSNVVLSIRVMNGQAHFWAAGSKNHAVPIRQELLDLFDYIARVAPGSYGLLYTLDDEDPAHNNEFRVYVLARGTRIRPVAAALAGLALARLH